jgi:hypothetical protein
MTRAAKNHQKPPGGREGPSRLRRWWAGLAPPRRRRLAAAAVKAVVVVSLVVAGVAVLRVLRSPVLEKRYGGPQGAAAVQLSRAPQWMPQSLAAEIVHDVTPPDASLADCRLAEKVYQRAAANPWVRRVCKVQVHPNPGRAGGVVRTDLEFRRPAARVRQGARYIYVDDDGHRLPITQVPAYVVTFQDSRGRIVSQNCYLSLKEVPTSWRAAARRIHYVTIDGVASTAPPPGWKWTSSDLGAGLRLLELVRTRPYYAQITLIDVRNHAGRAARQEPELRMYAQIGTGRPTDIRFGRFPAPGGGDYVISPQRKLSYLDEYAAEHGGRLAGINSYLDLRYDQLHVSIN